MAADGGRRRGGAPKKDEEQKRTSSSLFKKTPAYVTSLQNGIAAGRALRRDLDAVSGDLPLDQVASFQSDLMARRL